MTYSETIDYLYGTLPMFTRIGSAAFKKDLTNIRLLCEALAHPEKKLRFIHVAGTNGKGSVSHMLAAIMQINGYKTGLYTSPHLYDFRERIRVDGAMCSEAFVVDFVKKMKPAIEAIKPSFFEITVAMAFDYFVQQRVDIAIIEVGLGGRLDSTNIITPELSVITSIGWDHMNMLGDTLEAIAFEKAGIIKPGIPVVSGEKVPATEPVFRNAASECNAPLYFSDDIFLVAGHNWTEGKLQVAVQERATGQIETHTLDLPGIYQTRNLLTVLTALRQLPQWKTDPAKVRKALSQVKKLTGLQGRWELIRRRPDVVLEVAHNKEGMEQMLEHIRQLDFGRLRLVLGMVRDKDADAVLRLLPKKSIYYFSQAQMPRALEAETLRSQAASHGLQGAHFPDVNTALQAAIAEAAPEDLIIVCGSIFLVAEVDRELIMQLA